MKSENRAMSWFLLGLRILFGVLLMTHGLQKWMNFDTLSATFPDPLGVGSQISLGLAIFGEVICSAAFILGIFFRLSLIPMIFTMLVAFFVIHGSDPFAARELSFIYGIVFIMMYATGPGRFAFDRMIAIGVSKK
jgi:putative oxidoreductase